MPLDIEIEVEQVAIRNLEAPNWHLKKVIENCNNKRIFKVTNCDLKNHGDFMGKRTESLLPIERITSKIYLLRGEKVLLDSDLAELYGVEVKMLKRAVNRNIARFPEDFMFKLSKEEQASLRYQFGTLKRGQHSKYLPYVFTEQGVAMLSSVLNSERAVQVNIAIMRAFVQMRMFLQSSDALAKKLNELEKETKKKFGEHQKKINEIFETIKQLMSEKEKPKGKVWF